jgi:hypothetical protein
MIFSDWVEANQCKSSHWTLWCQNICFVTSTFFGKCTNMKLVYWIIPAISKTVYKNIINSLFKLPINSVYILELPSLDILGWIHFYIISIHWYMPGHNIWMDRQTDGRDSFIPPVFVCGSIITGEHLHYVYKHCAKFE